MVTINALALVQVFGGLPRLAKSMPLRSAAFLKMPARFIASVRSGPGGNARASSRALSASASRSSFDRGYLMCRAMAEMLSALVVIWMRGAVFGGRSRWFDGGPAGGVGVGGIAGHHPGFGVTALRAFECTILETFGT
jgi:hypothetical protein